MCGCVGVCVHVYIGNCEEQLPSTDCWPTVSNS